MTSEDRGLPTADSDHLEPFYQHMMEYSPLIYVETRASGWTAERTQPHTLMSAFGSNHSILTLHQKVFTVTV